MQGNQLTSMFGPVTRLLLVCSGLAFLSGGLLSQDIHGFSIEGGEDIFTREVQKAEKSGEKFPDLPLLDCSVEYLRRIDGKDVVYRRGPVDLQQLGATSGRMTVPADGGKPASGTEKPSFSGGILVDLPRIGEAASGSDFASDRFRYLLRIALLPQRYEGQLLHARLFLDRALVTVEGNTVRILQNEVFSREVELQGNVPLKFDLPAWDSAAEQAAVVPASLQESVLLTLEIPRYFALSQNEPDPFSASTRLRYAVPKDSDIRLTISIEGEEIVLDQGRRQAGKYEVQWAPAALPDETYTATISAADEEGTNLYSSQVSMRHDEAAPDLQSITRTGQSSMPGDIALSIESGVAYQLPADNAQPMRNMFTHLAFRVGYRFSSTLEAGLLAGQEAFNQKPGDDVDIEQIPNYGGVVAYSFGYVGGYARFTPGASMVQPVIQLSAGITDVAFLAEAGAGVRASIHPHLDVYLVPSLVMHFRSELSTKIGIHYGASVRF